MKQRILSSEQIEIFQRDGILVVDDILSKDQLQAAEEGLHQLLHDHNVDVNNLEDTGHHLRNLSSTNGSGGVLDLFYPHFKMDVSCNEKLFHATTELWNAGYCHNGETEKEMIAVGRPEQFHPFGKFDLEKGYAYIDRIGYRLPSTMAEIIGERLQNEREEGASNGTTCKKQSKRKNTAIQRSLTPHLDCCPQTYNNPSNKSKWRPIQCFVSLTDNLEANTGGFEAAPGFHRNFHAWTRERSPSTITKRNTKSGAKSKVQIDAPCVGEYTHIRPKEDAHVMKAVKHIPVRAGSAVFWDNRIPHANAYKNEGTSARAVIYCSFLPDVKINRDYVEKQLEDYRLGRIPRDQWINISSGENDSNVGSEEYCEEYTFSHFGEKLMNITPW